jgi:hypothetical protein
VLALAVGLAVLTGTGRASSFLGRKSPTPFDGPVDV